MIVGSYIKGLIAETLCGLYLKLYQGHQIISYRRKTPLGEIDIISRKNGITYITEVKYRSESLDAAKMALIQSKSRIYSATKWLRIQDSICLKYFVISFPSFEYGDYV